MDPLFTIANVIWPGIIAGFGLATSWAVPIGLVVEYPVVKHLTGKPWRAAIVVTVGVNLVSALLGLIFVPIAGIGIELARAVVAPESGSFNPATWALTFLSALILNTAIEGFALRRLFGARLDVPRVALFALANCASIAAAILLIWSGRISLT